VELSFWESLIEAARLLFTGYPVLWRVIGLTIQVTGTALLVSAVIGVPTGAAIGLTQFPGRRTVVAVLYTGMGLPPVVVGLAVYLLLSRSGPLGYLDLFTPPAMILAQTIIAFPLVAGLTMAGVEAIDPDFRLQVVSLGADRVQVVRAMLSEARGGVLAALLAGFGGIISEVGAAMLVGGNIAGQTRVLSTAIVLETRRGEFALAVAMGGVLLSLAFAVNALFISLERRSVWRIGR
jgi:tungstate transport system permease protein